MAQIVNLTIHDVRLLTGPHKNEVFEIPTTDVAYVDTASVMDFPVEVDGLDVPVASLTCKNIVGLPEPSRDVYYIVTPSVLKAAQESLRRAVDDLLVVDDVRHRDDEARVLTCTRFARI